VCTILCALGFPALAQDNNALSVRTGFAAGVYYPMGEGIAKVVSKSNVRRRPEPGDPRY
jgi:TRAP-type uncharacterized transport system substrate-binding protein